MIGRRFLLQATLAAVAAGYARSGRAQALTDDSPAALLLAELARLEARAYSEEGIPVFLACENVPGPATPPDFQPGELNRALAAAYRDFAALLPGLEREMTEYDAATLVELLAERDFLAGGQ